MKLTEILNKPLPFTVVNDDEGMYMAKFMAGKRVIVFQATNDNVQYGEGDDLGEWGITFGQQKGKSLIDNIDFGATKGGAEFEVFATINEIIKKFIEARDPKEIIFTADKHEGNRARLYSKLVAKNLPNGWKVSQKDLSGNIYTMFTLIKEALDKPLPYKITNQTPKFFNAIFTAGNRDIEFSADYSGASFWEISFAELLKTGSRETTKISGSGNEFQVFATVKALIDKFIQDYAPRRLTIDSFKGEANRAKLYQRMIAKNLPKGWKMDRDDKHPSYTTFTLIREGMMKRSDPYISGEKSGIRPPDVEHAPRPTTAHRSKLEALVKKSGKTYAQVENAWNKAVKEVPDGVAKWAKVMLRVKSDLGISI